MDEISYDEVGKVDLSGIYNEPDPRRYFSTLAQLDYRVAQEAKTAFQQIFAARREATGADSLKVIDVGCSYGVNAALLKYDLSIEQLSGHYEEAADLTRRELLALDADLFDGQGDAGLEVVGIDAARNAVAYALDAGIIDGAIATDLEARPPTVDDAALIAGADLVISTGCFGYVTSRTLERILEHCGESQPWMAHTVLRMFDFAEAEALFEAHGYVTEEVEGLVPQRRFASPEEQENTLANLAAAGVDPTGLEDQGWYFARLFVSRPQAVAEATPIGDVIQPLNG